MAKQKSITEQLKIIKNKYQILLEDAVDFYQNYEKIYAPYAKLTLRIEETDIQILTISAYKEKHGVYPNIKNHDDPVQYLAELQKINQQTKSDLEVIKPTVLDGFYHRTNLLNDISTSIANLLIHDRDANQFIATIMLQAPPIDSSYRCVNNEKTKPIYIAALSIAFIKKLILNGQLTDEHITKFYPKKVKDDQLPGQIEYNQEQLDNYINNVLVPIINAVLIHNIGSYSVEAEAIYNGNRYQLLEDKARLALIKIIHQHGINYQLLGLGRPTAHDYPDEHQLELKHDQFELTETIIENYSKAAHPLGNLLRIPMIYASFMLSTKPKHDYKYMFKAHDIIKSGIEKNIIYAPFAKHFLTLVGPFPLGCGIYFISKDSDVPERAVVIGLNPPEPNAAIVKQLTRRQEIFDDHTQVLATKNYIISYDAARKKSDFDAAYYKSQFPNGYFWNPSEGWEVTIDQIRFWRRDSKLKLN
jgi:hypothetical protein